MSNTPFDPTRLARVRELATAYLTASATHIQCHCEGRCAHYTARFQAETALSAAILAMPLGELAAVLDTADDRRRLNDLERVINAEGGVQIGRWDHDGRRWIRKDRDGYGLLLVHKFAARGGVDESLRDALDKLPAVYDFAASPESDV